MMTMKVLLSTTVLLGSLVLFGDCQLRRQLANGGGWDSCQKGRCELPWHLNHKHCPITCDGASNFKVTDEKEKCFQCLECNVTNACPDSEPSSGDSCPCEALACEYGPNRWDCIDGAFSFVDGDIPGDDNCTNACPALEPTNSTSCSDSCEGLECQYGEECCILPNTTTCECFTSNRWVCNNGTLSFFGATDNCFLGTFPNVTDNCTRP